ncbi:MAG: hypothetical protein KY432_05910 [Acidobacteria bacterium]|nr:hypothetical protein [Acidobacteriota bacterium]
MKEASSSERLFSDRGHQWGVVGHQKRLSAFVIAQMVAPPSPQIPRYASE